MASVGLLLAFFATTRLANLLHSSSTTFFTGILNFLRPGWKNHPVQWLVIESTILLSGAAAVALFAFALSNGTRSTRFREMRAAIMRQSWPPVLWALLLGNFATSPISIVVSIFGLGSGMPDRAPLLQAMSWLNYLTALAALYCSARLLFGRSPWRTDKWLGYIGAAVTLFGLSWHLIALTGLGDYLPILGVLGARGVLPLSAIFWMAIGVAATWTDLTLARRGEQAMLRRQDYAKVCYVAIAGFVLSAFISKISNLGFLVGALPAQLCITYVSVLGGATAVVLLCVLDGSALLTDAAGQHSAAAAKASSKGPGLPRRAWVGLSSARFWADFGLGLVVTLLLVGLAFGFVSQIPVIAAPFLMPLIVFGFLIGPIVMFVIGVLRGRPGFAAAPVIMVLAVFGYRYASLEVGSIRAKASVEEAANFNVYPFEEPTREHDMVVIEGAYDSRPDGDCQAVCKQILLKSSYAVAYAEQKSGQWRIYRLATGADFCRQPAQVKSYLEMIGSRRLDTCLAVTREPPHQDALVIREDYALDLPIKKQLPKGVTASVTEFYERINGQDRLLGRIVSGVVQPPLLSDKEPTRTAIQMSGAAFYAAALKLPLSDQHTLGNADPAAVVATLESLFSDPIVGDGARDRFRLFGGKTEAEVAPKRAAILRFWQSSDPQLIKLGLRSLHSIKNRGPDFAKPFVAQYLASDDPVVMQAAVSALYAFEQDLDFAKSPLADLILSERIANYTDRTIDSLTGILKVLPGGFAPEVRSRAKAQLDSRPDLADGRLLAVLAVVARGDAQTRQEAVDWMFAQQGEDLERAMAAVAHEYDALGAAPSVRFWTKQEIEQLIARSPSVSNKGLILYVRALEHQMEGRELRPALRDMLEDRAETLEKGTAADQDLAKKMRRAARDIRD